MNSSKIIKHLEEVLKSDQDLKKKLELTCEYLKNTVDHYDWVGYYFANHEKKTLHLGPYAGEPTDHTVIRFGNGICGQVAESNETFLVEDVHAQDNYIACSITVKSEIVVPLFVEGKNVGQVDIDSDTINAFTSDDKDLLRTINSMVSEVIINDVEFLNSFISK